MTKYIVKLKVSFTDSTTVEAESISDAIREAKKEISMQYGLIGDEIELVEVEYEVAL